MWKKEESPAPTPTPQREPAPKTERPAPTSGGGEKAAIGKSITIRGEVTGDEDLLIQGRVDGSVNLEQHAVTVGSDGDVKASIAGRVVVVEGRVEGNITSEEQVLLRSSAWVKGDIVAPRVVLEDGARFRGGIDMGEESPRDKGGDRGFRGEPGRPTDRARETSPTTTKESTVGGGGARDAATEVAS
jgi:cytoskeletal protein CcmA (bactofilin family)